MIVCSCRRISDQEIQAAIAWMRAADPHTLITPGKVYRALGKAPDCGGCVRLFVAEMRRSPLLEVRSEAGAAEVPPELRSLRQRFADEG
jgi:bacterioferritin-associated ferredoxin